MNKSDPNPSIRLRTSLKITSELSEYSGHSDKDSEHSERYCGFTLIELLVVIAVIAGLSTMFVTTYPSAMKRTRDTHRRSDLKQYQNALEIYANKNNGLYPIEDTTVVKPSSLCGAGNPLGSIACTEDPKDGKAVCSTNTCAYQYITDASGTDYSLWATLEQPVNPTDIYFIVCSDGRAGEDNTAPSVGNVCTL